MTDKKRLLIQTQLSNYDKNGTYILEADSGWQMTSSRAVQMLELNPDLEIDILVPSKVKTKPEDLLKHNRIKYIKQLLTKHAISNRYDFDYIGLEVKLKDKNYTHVYINDPMQLRNYKTLFYMKDKENMPKFITHSHFVDNPSAPKVPKEVSYWYGQIEAAIKSDVNFWQCESTLEVLEAELKHDFKDHLVNAILDKSYVWDDGYSYKEINTPIDYDKLRFTLPDDKIIVFVPNRVGDDVRTSDYTNCGKFLFHYVNKLYEQRQDFVVVAGNPSLKISNDEINEKCKPYIKLLDDDTFTRNEYRYVASKSHINVGLYNVDTYGGTAFRECIDLGCLPLALDLYEYKKIFDLANYNLGRVNFTNLIEKLPALIDFSKTDFSDKTYKLTKVIRERCSYEHTTKEAMKLMGLL